VSFLSGILYGPLPSGRVEDYIFEGIDATNLNNSFKNIVII
jgi:hypothetical protein